eukprot:SAG22_NODE_1477_length_4328_cov_2.451643_6_plen_90_part_00
MCFLQAGALVVVIAVLVGVQIAAFWAWGDAPAASTWDAQLAELLPLLRDLPPAVAAVVLATLGIVATMVAGWLFGPSAPSTAGLQKKRA